MPDVSAAPHDCPLPRPASRPGPLAAAVVVAALTAALAVSLIAGTALGGATIAFGDALRFLWAALTGISLLRTAGFMGALAVVAAVYAERHGLTGAGFTLVWTVSGAPFFAGNWFSGRLLSVRDADAALMAGGIVASLAGVALVFAASPFALMVTGTAVLAVGHAMIAAGVTTGLARLADPARSAALAVNGVAQAAGTVAGAALAGAGYALAGWPGVAWALAAVTVPCAALLVMTRAGRN